MEDEGDSKPTSSNNEYSETQSSSDQYEPKSKQPRIKLPTYQMRVPIILPKLQPKPTTSHGTAIRLITSPPTIAPSSSNPRPLISLLDRTEFRDRSRIPIVQPVAKPKKCYYTEMNEIRREFGIPDTFDTTKPNTMSGMALAEKLQVLQRLRGENKFLHESIEKKRTSCEERNFSIEQIRRSTNEIIEHCQMMKETLQDLEEDSLQMRNQIE